MCSLSFVCDSEENFSFALLHGQFVITLRSSQFCHQRRFVSSGGFKYSLIHRTSCSARMFLNSNLQTVIFAEIAQNLTPAPLEQFLLGPCSGSYVSRCVTPQHPCSLEYVRDFLGQRCCVHIISPVLAFPTVARRDLLTSLKDSKSVVETSDISDVGDSRMVACMRFPLAI